VLRSQTRPGCKRLYTLIDRRLPANRALEKAIEIYGDAQLAKSRAEGLLRDEPAWLGSIEVRELVVIAPRAELDSTAWS
jgi:hypothetical protein